MKQSSYSTEVSSWLNPTAVVEALKKYTADPKEAVKDSTLLIFSNILQSGNQGGLYELVLDYLQEYSFPYETLELLKVLHPEIPKESWNWLERYQFTGTVSIDPPVDQPNFKLNDPVINPLNMKPVLSVTAEDVITDIFDTPINMLAGLVGYLTNETWQHLSKVDHKSVRFQQFSNGPLFAYIEARIAKSYGILNASISGVLDNGIRHDYRSVALVGKTPFDPTDIAVAKSSAVTLAKQTLKSMYQS